MDIEAVLGTWSAGPGTLHRKLSGALAAAIEQRTLLPAQRLPSERELARRLLVSRSTVVAAYDELRAQGLLESVRGSGTRVATLPTTDAGWEARLPITDNLNPVYRALFAEPSEMLSLAAALNPPHPLVGEVMQEVARTGLGELLSHAGYLPFGLPDLRTGIAKALTGLGLATDADQVLVTTGAQQAISLCAHLLTKPGDTLVVESPGFPGTLDAFRAASTRFATVPVDDQGVDVDRVRSVVDRTNPAAVYVMPSFHNPTGVALSAHRREQLAELAARSGVPIIEDNVLEHLNIGDAPPPPVASMTIDATAPVLTVGSFSKLAWGGLRVGWVRGPRALVERLGHLKARVDLGTPLFDQAVAARLLDELPRLQTDRRAELTTALERVTGLLREWLPDWKWQAPQGGAALWVALPTGTSAEFAQVALRFGVEVIPGEMMSPTGEHPQHLRLPFTNHGDRIDVVIHRLGQAWTAYLATPHAARGRSNVVV